MGEKVLTTHRAWMFASGLLLGFCIFTKENDSTLESFDHALAVLEFLADESPQAGHYHDILMSFREAIISRQRQLSEQKIRSTNQYLDQIFTNAAVSHESGLTPSISVSSTGYSPPDLVRTNNPALVQSDAINLDVFDNSLHFGDRSIPDDAFWPLDGPFDCTGASFFEDTV
jgi:hypothetical protein